MDVGEIAYWKKKKKADTKEHDIFIDKSVCHERQAPKAVFKNEQQKKIESNERYENFFAVFFIGKVWCAVIVDQTNCYEYQRIGWFFPNIKK